MFAKPEIKRNYPITTDNIQNVGGKDMVLKRMVNHYNALINTKPMIDMSKPHPHVNEGKKNTKLDIHYKQEFHNVREAYKKVSKVKPYVDNAKPYTYDMKPKGKYKSCKEQYDTMEHYRILEAMSKRILSFGKPHERKKNKEDPIANPTYFFRGPQHKTQSNKTFNETNKEMSSTGMKSSTNGFRNSTGLKGSTGNIPGYHNHYNEDVTKIISLSTLNERLKQANTAKRNKLLLGNSIYNAINQNKKKTRPKSSGMTINRKGYYYESGAPLYADLDPEEYIKIHTFNRDGTVLSQKKKVEEIIQKEEELTKMKLKGKSLPYYNGDMEEFEDEIRNFVIENTVYKDEDIDLMKRGILMKNKDNPDITPEQIKAIVQKIKKSLDEDEDNYYE